MNLKEQYNVVYMNAFNISDSSLRHYIKTLNSLLSDWKIKVFVLM